MRVKVPNNEIKNIILEGLIYFKSICKKLNIEYYLAFGSLIGAVRHNGFIPWDDDIDILVPREDYERLKALAPIINNEKFNLLSYSNEHKFLFPYMKLCNTNTVVVPSRFSNGFLYGLSIDIFPLDTISAESEEQVKITVQDLNKTVIYWEKKCYKSGVCKKGIVNGLKREVKKVLFYFNKKATKNLLDSYQALDLQMSQQQDDGQYAVYLFNRYNTVWLVKDFKNKTNKEIKFEGELFAVPTQYDIVLFKTYGDYLQLPAMEDRKSNHTFTAYYIN